MQGEKECDTLISAVVSIVIVISVVRTSPLIFVVSYNLDLDCFYPCIPALQLYKMWTCYDQQLYHLFIHLAQMNHFFMGERRQACDFTVLQEVYWVQVYWYCAPFTATQIGRSGVWSG